MNKKYLTGDCKTLEEALKCVKLYSVVNLESNYIEGDGTWTISFHAQGGASEGTFHFKDGVNWIPVHDVFTTRNGCLKRIAQMHREKAVEVEQSLEAE